MAAPVLSPVRAARALRRWRVAPRRSGRPAGSPWARALRTRFVLAGPAIFTAIVLVQGGHMMEHVVQAVQKYGFGFDHAHGVLGMAVDRELVHFAYNTFLFLGLLAVVAAFGIGQRWRDGRRGWMVLLVGATLIQAYHYTEHWTKLLQWLGTGLHDQPGILGHAVPVILLHFAFNTVVTVPLMAAWMCWRAARKAGVVDRPLAVALREGLVAPLPPREASFACRLDGGPAVARHGRAARRGARHPGPVRPLAARLRPAR